MMTPEALADQIDALSRQVASLQSRFASQDQAALEAALSPADLLRFGAYPTGADVYPAGTTTPGAENIIATGAITADTIAANAITAGKIAAGAVTADKLTVGAVSGQASLVPNHSFEDGTLYGAIASWTLGSTGVGSGVFQESTGSIDGTRCLSLTAIATTGEAHALGTNFGVVAGEALYCRASVLPDTTSTGGLYFGLDFFTAAGASVSTLYISNNVATTATVRQTPQGYITVPATATQARVQLYNFWPSATGTLLFDQVIVQRAAGGVRNSTSETIIDATGVTITNGAITVTNAGATVIIDGTSNMFKIAATGTTSQLCTDNASATGSVSLSALGAVSVVPAFQAFLSLGASETTSKWASPTNFGGLLGQYVAASSGGSPTVYAGVLSSFWSVYMNRDGSNYPRVNLFGTLRGHGASETAYARYYVLKEAAM